MPRISVEFSLGAIFTLGLYLLEKTGKNGVLINLVLLVATAGLCLHAGLSIPWTWAPESVAWKYWRGCLVMVTVLLAVGAFGIWTWPERKAMAKTNTTSQQNGPEQHDSQLKVTAKETDTESGHGSPERKMEGATKQKQQKPPVVIQESQGNNSPNVATFGNNSPATVTINPPVNPNAPVVTYDFDGVKHTQTGNRFEAEAGEQTDAFRKLAALEREHNWNQLREEAEAQTKSVPNWLTPYLFAAEAYANLGNASEAIKLCEFVRKQSGGNPAFAKPADNLLNRLNQP
jgi:hypothetical protein